MSVKKTALRDKLDQITAADTLNRLRDVIYQVRDVPTVRERLERSLLNARLAWSALQLDEPTEEQEIACRAIREVITDLHFVNETLSEDVKNQPAPDDDEREGWAAVDALLAKGGA